MGIEDSVAEKIRGYCRSHAIRVMYLFGSYARGEATPSSDIDLLVEFEEGFQISYLNLLQIEYDLEKLTNTQIDLVEQNAIDNPVRRKRIIEERVLLYAS